MRAWRPGHRAAEPAHALHARRRRAGRGADRPRDRGGRRSPLAGLGPGHEHAERIAELVAELVDDGSTLQLGIGQVPDATLRALAGRRKLAIWSEMISDGVMTLERDGALDPTRPIVCSFLFGSPELYEWVDQNPRLRMTRTETTNDPSRIAAHARWSP